MRPPPKLPGRIFRVFLAGLGLSLAAFPAFAQFDTPKSIDDLEQRGARKPQAPRAGEPASGDAAEESSDEATPAPAAAAEQTAPPPEAAPSQAPAAEAGTGSPPAPEAAVAARPSGPGKATEILPPPENGAEQLLQAWKERQEALEEKDVKIADRALERIRALRLDLGARDLFGFSAALVRESEQLSQGADPGEAVNLAHIAAELSPDLPYAWLAVAKAAFRDDVANSGRYLSALIEAAKATVADHRARRALRANLFAAGFAAGLAAACALALLVFARHARYVLHDFHHFFPKAASPVQTSLFLFFLLSIPLAFKLGLFFVLLGFVALAWLYMSATERICAGLLLVGLGLAPMAAEWAIRMTTLGGTTAELVYLMDRDPLWGGSEAGKLAEIAKDKEAPYPVLFALGRYHRHMGQLEEALAYLRRAGEAQPSAPEALNELGNALFLKGDLGGAEQAYARATDQSTDFAAGYFNLYKVHQRRSQTAGTATIGNELEKGQEDSAKANRADHALIARFMDQDEPKANRFLVDVPLAEDDLSDLAESESRSERAATQARKRIFGEIPEAAAPFVPFGLLLVLLLALSVRRPLLRPSAPCRKCGRAVCQRCDSEVKNGDLCGQCVHVFARTSGVDASTRVRKEVAIRRYQARQEKIARFLAFVLAGGGHVFSGKTARGAAYLLLFLFLVFSLVFRQGVVRPFIGGVPHLLKIIPLGLAMLLLYFAALRGLWQRKVS